MGLRKDRGKTLSCMDRSVKERLGGSCAKRRREDKGERRGVEVIEKCGKERTRSRTADRYAEMREKFTVNSREIG